MTTFPNIQIPDELAHEAEAIPGLRERLLLFIRAEVAVHRRKQSHYSPEVLEVVKRAREKAAAMEPLSEEAKAQARKEFVGFYEELMDKLK